MIIGNDQSIGGNDHTRSGSDSFFIKIITVKLSQPTGYVAFLYAGIFYVNYSIDCFFGCSGKIRHFGSYAVGVETVGSGN